jgi:hypothetical protein
MFFPSQAVVGEIEDFGNGVTREFALGGQIVILTCTGTTTRENVDTWFNLIMDTYHRWEPGKPMLLLSDISDPAQGITTYSRQRTQEFTRYMRPGVTMHMANVLNNAVMANMMTLLLRNIGHPTRSFTRREEALSWLRRVAMSRTQLD